MVCLHNQITYNAENVDIRGSDLLFDQLVKHNIFMHWYLIFTMKRSSTLSLKSDRLLGYSQTYSKFNCFEALKISMSAS